MELPQGPFDLIYADPPWPFKTYSAKGQGRSPGKHYKSTMGVGEIGALDIAAISAPDSCLALWVYGPMLPWGLTVMQQWGFSYKSDLMVWVKITGAGKPAFGTGYYTRKGAEQMLLGTRGRGLKVVDRGVRQCLMSPRREHSRKPDEAALSLERLFGSVRRVELFARTPRPGWTCWGDELKENQPNPRV